MMCGSYSSRSSMVHLMPVEVGQRCEALRMLRGQIAVRHGMANHDRVPAQLAQLGGNPARDRALAASGADGADRDDRHFRDQLRALGAQQPEIGASGDGARGQVHQRRIGDVAVGKDHHIHQFVADDLFHLVFFEDGNAIGIEIARQLRGITAAGDVGNLGWR